jgi:hypothetical protein
MMEGGIFLTVKDLMRLNGSNNYFSCAKQHRTLRDSITTGKKKLMVKEYCDQEKIDFDYVWKFLRG